MRKIIFLHFNFFDRIIFLLKNPQKKDTISSEGNRLSLLDIMI